MRNIHSCSPKGCIDVCFLLLSYFFPTLILLLILAANIVYSTYFILLLINNCSAARVSICIVCLLLGNGEIVMLLWAFFRAVATPAGYVTSEEWKWPPLYVGSCKDFTQNAESEPRLNPHTVTQLDRNQRLRFCLPCNQYKPDNSHHCDMCRRCTYNFDHHCPLLNNCIGRDNYKFFLLVIVYVSVACFIEGGLILMSLFTVDRTQNVALWLLFSISVTVIGSSITFFSLLHIWWLYHGESTMSSHIASLKKKSKTQSPSSHEERKEKRRLHWEAVLGTDRRCWRLLLPLHPTRNQKRTDFYNNVCCSP